MRGIERSPLIARGQVSLVNSNHVPVINRNEYSPHHVYNITIPPRSLSFDRSSSTAPLPPYHMLLAAEIAPRNIALPYGARPKYAWEGRIDTQGRALPSQPPMPEEVRSLHHIAYSHWHDANRSVHRSKASSCTARATGAVSGASGVHQCLKGVRTVGSYPRIKYYATYPRRRYVIMERVRS